MDTIQAKTKIVKLKDISPYSRNAKVHSPEQIKALKKSIKDNGYTNIISLDKDNII